MNAPLPFNRLAWAVLTAYTVLVLVLFGAFIFWPRKAHPDASPTPRIEQPTSAVRF